MHLLTRTAWQRWQGIAARRRDSDGPGVGDDEAERSPRSGESLEEACRLEWSWCGAITRLCSLQEHGRGEAKEPLSGE